MAHYRRMFFWQNASKLYTLFEYRDLVIDYFNEAQPYDLFEMHDTEKSIQLRSKINRTTQQITDALYSVGIVPVIHWTPPAMIGGYSQNIDLVNNLFNLRRYQIHPQTLIDILDKAIGIYSADRVNSFLRTVNPLFWVYLLINYFVRLPFKLLGLAGFNQRKIEGSLLGKIFAGVFTTLTYTFTLIQILEKLGMLDRVKEFIGIPTNL